MRKYTAARSGRLSEVLTEADGELTRAALRRALGKKDVKVNGARVREDCEVRAGDEIEVWLPESAFVPLCDVLYEDGDVLVADKRSGVETERLEAFLAARCGARAVHRLDRNTAGVIAFAKNDRAEKILLDAFRERRTEKYYLAEVYGADIADEGEFADYLEKDSEKGRVFVSATPRAGAVRIRTGFRTLARGNDRALLLVRLYTGKTHQIRAHLAFHGHFVIGDGKYGSEKVNRALGAKSQRLLSFRLTFRLRRGELPAVNGRTFESRLAEALFPDYAIPDR